MNDDARRRKGTFVRNFVQAELKHLLTEDLGYLVEQLQQELQRRSGVLETREMSLQEAEPPGSN